MIVKIFLTAIFAAACAQEKVDVSDVDILKRLTEEGRKAVQVAATNIFNSPMEFDGYIKDRLDCLKWECVVQKQNLNKTITEAVFQGMLKNKQFTNFQCISKAAKETENKLDAISNQISTDSEDIKQKELSGIMPLGSVVRKFYLYLDDLFRKKSNELIKTENESARKKIMEDVGKKIKHLNSILEKINGHVKSGLFVFFEKYVNFAFKTEKSLRDTQKDGANAIMRCVF